MFGSPTKRSAGSTRNALPTTEDKQRHEAMMRTVFDWMNRTKATQQALVRLIEDFWRKRSDPTYKCDHSLVSRILNPAEPHIPTANRPKSMRIQQAAMIICSRHDDPNLIESATDDDTSWSSDAEQAFKIHRARLRQLRDAGRGDLFRSLHRLGELVALAGWMDDGAEGAEGASGETLRQRACENALLTLAALADQGEAGVTLADKLMEQGVGPADAKKLAEELVKRADRLLSAPSQVTVNMRAYAGAAIFHAGQADRGMDMMLQACADAHDIAKRHDPHWETLFELIERLFEAESDSGGDAIRYSQRAANLAAKQLADTATPGKWDLVRRAWEGVETRRIREHWKTLLPGGANVVTELDRGLPTPPPTVTPGNSKPEPANNGVRKKARKPGITAGLLALSLLTQLAFAAFAPSGGGGGGAPVTALDRAVSAASSELTLAIRGKEANAPQPPRGGGSRGSQDA